MKNMYFLNNFFADNYFKKNCYRLYDGVYRLGNEKVIKKIDSDKSQSIYAKFSCDELLQFKDINIKGFSFAKALVYTKLCNIYAVINEYIAGDSLEEKFLSNYYIEDVIIAIRNIEIAIKNLSDLNICVNDIHSGNIIFDGKNMTLIDTTEYYYRDDCLHIYEENMLKIIDVIFRNLFSFNYNNKFASVYNIHKYFNIRGSRLEKFREFEYLMNPIETLFNIKKFIEDDFGIELNTFGECYRYINKVIENNSNSRIRVIKK